MNANRKQPWLTILAALLVLFSPLQIRVLTMPAGTASAADQSRYGEKSAIGSVEEALKAFKRHFQKKDVVIGEVVEKELYFEAEIRDRNNTVIDTVIIDKRTGRIRSIY